MRHFLAQHVLHLWYMGQTLDPHLDGVIIKDNNRKFKLSETSTQEHPFKPFSCTGHSSILNDVKHSLIREIYLFPSNGKIFEEKPPNYITLWIKY